MRRMENMLLKFALLLLILSSSFSEHTHYLDEILSFVDQGTDPCEDFYKHACGNWKPKVIETRNDKTSLLMSLEDKVVAKINNFLINENSISNFEKYLNPLRKYYQVCINYTVNPVKKSDLYLNILKEMGGFPALDENWNSQQFNWMEMAANMTNFGVKSIFVEMIAPFFPFPFTFQKMNLGFNVALNLQTFKNQTDLAYQLNANEMLTLLRLYGLDNESSEVIVKEILEFLKGLLIYSADLLDSSYIENLNLSGVEDNFYNLIQIYMKVAWNLTDKTSINDIIKYQSESVKKIFNKIISVVNEARPDIVANYLSLKFLYYLHGDQDLRSINNDKFCTLDVMNLNGFFTSLLYNSTLSSEEELEKSQDIFNLIREILKSYEFTFKNTSWLDEKTKQEAEDKILKMKFFIGQADDNNLKYLILEQISKLNFTNDYESNYLQLLRLKVELTHLPYKWRLSLKNTTKAMELLDSAQINACYLVMENAVYISNGLLNEPVYSPHQPAPLKYGRMGLIIGHELFHAFDNSGRQFDSHGKQRGWFSKTPETIYKNKFRCLKNSLNQIYMEDVDIWVNGDRTLDETLADSVGMAMAYDAFLRNSEHENNKWFINNNVTKEQVFFLSLAQLYCFVYSKSIILTETDYPHLSDHLRVQTAIKHSPIFGKHFQCDKGTKMNPRKKCKLF